MSAFSSAGGSYGGGLFSPPGSLLPSALRARIASYKREVAKRYRMVTPDRIGEATGEGSFHISTKVDGELWFLAKLGGEVAFVAPNGRVLEGVPVCQEAERQLAGCGDLLAAGELFCLTKDRRTRSADIARALSDEASAPLLGWKGFDLLDDAGEDLLSAPYAKRWDRLRGLFSDGRRSGLVTAVEGHVDAVHARFDEWVNSGKFEGLVVRNELGVTWKVKPAVDLDVVVLGFGERRTQDSADIRELIIGLLRDDGDYHVLGTVANGLSDADKIAWLARLEALVVPSEFRMANSEGSLCRFVRPQIVLEVRCSEILDSDGRDAAVKRMALAWDPATGWKPRGLLPFVSLLHPVFVRERTDKPVEPAYVGTAQVTAIVPYEAADNAAPALRKPSRIVSRRVWTKGGKGGTAVRKALVIETQKGGPDSDWPPFVAFFTDYAAGRKEPLQTSLVVAASLGQAEAAVQAWMEESIKKGWELQRA